MFLQPRIFLENTHSYHALHPQDLVKNGESVNVTERNKYTPLIAAALQGRTAVVRFLIRRGARINEVRY
jgi:ankyrin repeat protein